MAQDYVINVDLADVYKESTRKGFIHSLAWGDAVEVVEITDKYVCINTDKFVKSEDGSYLPTKTKAYICPVQGSGVKAKDVVIPKKDNRVLKINFVDVQQGDGAVIESPDGKIILVDGGDNVMFSRYLAARFPGSSLDNPVPIECIIVTHGDADHFSGLTEIFQTETNKTLAAKKRIFIAPRRVYHNGLVKRPGSAADAAQLGATKKVDNQTIITGLEENLLGVPDGEMNKPFKAWKKALKTWNQRSSIEFRRLSFGQDDAFDFIKDNGIKISVLGPILTEKSGVKGLKFLGEPPKGPCVGHDALGMDTGGFKGMSVSHTINGHSIVFKLTYGDFSYLFSGDLNEEAGRILTKMHKDGGVNLCSEVFKVPHHGSADFSGAFLQSVSPMVSVVSSGDESAQKEYIHPRATLMSALGRYARSDDALLFVTELVAFFQLEGPAQLLGKTNKTIFAFSRDVYGIVKTRTDGKRLFVYTDSGKTDLKEAYSFKMDSTGMPTADDVIRV
jgi:beta-lactamase superfamily II metal-dependent hydrolase